jgi:hypothetical protein
MFFVEGLHPPHLFLNLTWQFLLIINYHNHVSSSSFVSIAYLFPGIVSSTFLESSRPYDRRYVQMLVATCKTTGTSGAVTEMLNPPLSQPDRIA